MTFTEIRNYVVEAAFSRRMLPGSQSYVQTSQTLQDVQDLSRSAAMIGTEMISLQKEVTSSQQQYLADLRDVQDKVVGTYASQEALKKIETPEVVKQMTRQLEVELTDRTGKKPTPEEVAYKMTYYKRNYLSNLEQVEREKLVRMMDSPSGQKKFEKIVTDSEDYKIASLGQKVASLQIATGAIQSLNRTIEAGIAIAGIVEDKARRKRESLRDIKTAEALLQDTDEIREQGEAQLQAIRDQLRNFKAESLMGDFAKGAGFGFGLGSGLLFRGLRAIYLKIKGMGDKTEQNLKLAKELQ